MQYLSKNNFELLVSKDTPSTSTVISLSSGRIYRGPTKQIFNSKKGIIKKIKKKSPLIEVEKSIYGMIINSTHLGKGVSLTKVQDMISKLKPVDNYAKIKIGK